MSALTPDDIATIAEVIDTAIAQRMEQVYGELEAVKQHNIVDPDSPGAMEGPLTSEIPDAANPAGAEVLAAMDRAAVAAERQKHPEYSTRINRYESQVQLLNSMREHAERSEGEATSRNPIDILEPAVAVEDR